MKRGWAYKTYFTIQRYIAYAHTDVKHPFARNCDVGRSTIPIKSASVVV